MSLYNIFVAACEIKEEAPVKKGKKSKKTEEPKEPKAKEDKVYELD